MITCTESSDPTPNLKDNPFAALQDECEDEAIDWSNNQCINLAIKEDKMTWIHSNCEWDAWSDEEEPAKSVYTDTAYNSEGETQPTLLRHH